MCPTFILVGQQMYHEILDPPPYQRDACMCPLRVTRWIYILHRHDSIQNEQNPSTVKNSCRKPSHEIYVTMTCGSCKY